MDTTVKLICLLRRFTSSKSILQGKTIHQKILTLGLRHNSTLCKFLINFYFSCHLYDSSTLVFRTIENPTDISLWNGLLAAYTKKLMFSEALELFEHLLYFPYISADKYTYPSVLKACGELGRVGHGKRLHCHLVKTGFLSDVFVSSSLLTMYAKCDMFVCAEQVFDEIPERDVRCWNAVISCYYQHGRPEKVVELFEAMKSAGFVPDSVTFMVVISSCARLLDLKRGKRIHNELIKTGNISQGFVRDSLVEMYGKCGCLDLAKHVFGQIPKKNAIVWNSIISAYSLKGNTISCFQLLQRMVDEGTRPTLTTFSSLLLACIRSVQLHCGKLIHGYILRNGIEPDIYINSLLIDMYFKCGIVSSARNVFIKIARKNVLYSNVMIKGYVDKGHYVEALDIYDAMKEGGLRPDVITFTSVLPACSKLTALERGKEIHESVIESMFENNELVMSALLNMYAKCGALEEAIDIFHRLPWRDIVSWTSMISAYGSHGRAIEAIEIFQRMLNSNEKPDGIAFLAVLSACSHGGLIDQGCNYFNKMVTEYRIKPSVEHYSCLLDLLGRAGRLQEAYQILIQNMDDVDLLSTLLSACLLNKDIDLGIKVARILIDKNPDDLSSYIVLSNIYACDGKWNEFRELRLKIKELGLRKSPGCSWIEIDKRVYTFFAEDNSHPQTQMIYECLQFLASHIGKYNSCSDTSLTQDTRMI